MFAEVVAIYQELVGPCREIIRAFDEEQWLDARDRLEDTIRHLDETCRHSGFEHYQFAPILLTCLAQVDRQAS
jgi:hypothetical protein